MKEKVPEKKFDWGVTFNDQEFYHVAQAEELIAGLESPAKKIEHMMSILSSRDRPVAMANRRRQITSLQTAIGVIKQRYIEEYGLTSKSVRHYDPYRIRSQRIKMAIDTLAQQ